MSTGYPSDWDSRRRKVYKRDDYTCQNCGVQGGPYGNIELHAHHVVPKSRGGTHEVSNLISLCIECHNAVHNKNSEAPTANHRYNNRIDYSDPDFGELGNIIFEDTIPITTEAYQLLANTEPEHYKESLEFKSTLEAENELRIEIIRIFEHISMLRSSSTHWYPTDIVEAVEKSVEEAENLLIIAMDSLSLVEECISDLIDQSTSCPTCGTTIEYTDAFCGGCGTNLPEMAPSCPACGFEISQKDDFCRNCGEELEEHQEGILDRIDVDPDWYRQKHNILNQAEESLVDHLLSLSEYKIRSKLNSEMLTTVVWEYCPSCGFPEGALRSTSGIKCVLCESEWRDRGFINQKVEMTKGKKSGKSMKESKWEPLGEQRYQEEHYRKVLLSGPIFTDN